MINLLPKQINTGPANAFVLIMYGGRLLVQYVKAVIKTLPIRQAARNSVRSMASVSIRMDVLLRRLRVMLLLLLLSSFCAIVAAQDVDLSALPSSKGFRILGGAPDDRCANSVSNAGDVNGDGVDDVIIGAFFADTANSLNAGVSYVIFGRDIPGGATAFNEIQLPLPGIPLAAHIGFRILGASSDDRLGSSVSAAGDVNNDGVDDIIVGAYVTNYSGFVDAGMTYVIFGRSPATQGSHPFGDIQTPTLTMPANVGFRILGADDNHYSGWSVSGAGDVNGDGIDDIIVGAYNANPVSGNEAGISYVIFGRDIPGSAPAFGDIQLTTGSNVMSINVGFRILGAAADDQSGFSVSKAGDVNGDGIGDIIIGAYQAIAQGSLYAGVSYVIFGRSGATQVSTPFNDIALTLNALPVNIGFRILGAAQDDNSGWSVSTAGDFNGDGIDDIIVGARYPEAPGKINSGVVYIVFGRNVAQGSAPFGDILLSNGATPLVANIGFRIFGAVDYDAFGTSVKYANDVNGDDIGDIIVGAYLANPTPSKNGAGISYVFYGRNLSAPGTSPFTDIYLSDSVMDASIGFRILGAAPLDSSGISVSAAGDVNNDGIGDVIVGAQNANIDAGDDAGISYVIFGLPPPPTSQPSSEPSGQPSRQPSTQPTRQPSQQPSSQPTKQPQSLPSGQPSRQPSAQPSSQPSAQPSAQPLTQPTSQPSRQPSVQPSNQPSRQPSGQPTRQPTCAPSTQPSGQPTRQPSAQPTNQPSNKPSGRPSTQPTSQPLSHPSAQPSGQPSRQPSSQPSAQPSLVPSLQPSRQPTSIPTAQPTLQPRSQPSNQPSMQPSVQPTSVPSRQPSQQPSAQPSSLPSTQPSMQPASAPSAQPSSEPSVQPSIQPSSQPTIAPTVEPFAVPTVQPSAQPSSQPSRCPTSQPSSRPSSQPTSNPSAQPSSIPTVQPSSQPIHSPSMQPSTQPTWLPTSQPSLQPSTAPSEQPSGAPTQQSSASPTSQPKAIPTSRPSALPTCAPSSLPTAPPTGEWVTALNNTEPITELATVQETVWVCRANGNSLTDTEALCAKVSSDSGEQLSTYSFPWSDVMSVLQLGDISHVMLTGRITNADSVSTEIALCETGAMQLTCRVTSLLDTNYIVGTFVSTAGKVAYFGSFEAQVFVTVLHTVTNAMPSYRYSTNRMSTVVFTHAHSPPNYVGSFLAGTCTSVTLLNYICAGMMRTDSGIITAMYIAPASGSILNSAELVNAMVLEYEKPDSFIAGGIELSDGAGMHAYVVRANSLFHSVLYGVRYRMYTRGPNNRRTLQDGATYTSVVKGMSLLESHLFLIVTATESAGSSSESRLHVLKADMATGQILKQVQIYSPAASLSCTDITSTRLHLTMSCTVTRDNRRSQSLLLTMDLELTLSQLPSGFGRYENHTFTAEQVAFYRTMLPLTVESIQRSSNDYAFFAAEGNTQRPSPAPTFHPSLQPSGHPSSQPSSSPTSGPSVSLQPSSQPSSSRPTNTYKPTVKPTVKPTQRPSAAPTRAPTRSPTMKPTAKPTAGPTVAPSAVPSAHRTVVPVAAPTRCPSTKPTRTPTLRSSAIPTDRPSIAPTAEASTVEAKAPNNNQAYLIVGYVVAGLAGLWLLYILRQYCSYMIDGVQSDANRKVYAESMDAKPKPRFPICSYIVSFFCTVEAVEIGFIPVVATDTLYSGVGANIDGPDLEANKPARGTNKSKKLNEMTAKQEASKSDSESDVDVDVMLSEESSYHSCDYEYEDASSLSAEEEEVEHDYDGGDDSGADSLDKEDEDYSGEELSEEKGSEVEGSEGQGFGEGQEGEEAAYYDEVSAGEQSSGGSAVVYSLSSSGGGADRRSASGMESLHSDMNGNV